MSQYNILPDPQLPDDDEIRASMNFETVYERAVVPARPSWRWWQRLRKRPRLVAGLPLVFVVGLLVFEAIQEEEQAKSQYEAMRRALDTTTARQGQDGAISYLVRNDTHWVQVRPGGAGPLVVDFELVDSQQVEVFLFNTSRNIWEKKSNISPAVTRLPIFHLDILSSEFPELATARDWQQLSGPSMDSLQQTRWENVVAQKGENGTYIIRLEKGSKQAEIVARPVAAGARPRYRCTFRAGAGVYRLTPGAHKTKSPKQG